MTGESFRRAAGYASGGPTFGCATRIEVATPLDYTTREGRRGTREVMATPARDLGYFVGNAEEFPILGRWDFFNHAGVCPLPKCAADAIRDCASQYEDHAYL